MIMLFGCVCGAGGAKYQNLGSGAWFINKRQCWHYGCDTMVMEPSQRKHFCVKLNEAEQEHW